MNPAWEKLAVEPGLELDSWVCRGSEPDGPKVLIAAGVHGDEYEGPLAVLRLTEWLASASIRGTVIALPVANPLAFAAGTRTTPADGRNLAREFPGDAAGTVTQRLAHTIYARVASGVDYLIDLHSGGVEYEFTPLAGFYGAPGAGNASYQAARRSGFPVLWRLPETAGVLSCEVAKQGAVAIGHEYLGGGRLSVAGAETYRKGALSTLRYWGVLSDEPPLADGGLCVSGDWQLSPCDGIFVAKCALLHPVKSGQVVAEIQRVPGNTEQIVAERDGIVLALRNKAGIRENNWAVLIGTPEEAA